MKNLTSQSKIIVILSVILTLCLLIILVLVFNGGRGADTQLASLDVQQEASEMNLDDDTIPVNETNTREVEGNKEHTLQRDGKDTNEYAIPAENRNTSKQPSSPVSSTSSPPEKAVGDSGMDSINLPVVISKINDVPSYGELHTIISGFWTFEGDKFVGFVYQDDSKPSISYGLLHTAFQVDGVVIAASSVGDKEVELTILIPAMEETMVHEAKPERTEIVRIDFSNYYDGRLNISVVGLYDSEWKTYEFGAGMLEDLY